MMLIITTTKGRPKAFEVLKTLVQNQTTDDFDWLVVTDDWEGYKFPKKAKVIKRDNSADTLPSLCHNWLAALDYIEAQDKYDKFIVLEDDDWVVSSYVHQTNRLLDKADLAGWNEDAYYYVLNRHMKRVHNTEHASLAATAFRRCVLPFLRECVEEGDIFIDAALWKGYTGRKVLADNFTGIVRGSLEQPKLDRAGNIANEQPRHVGMKTNWHGGEDGLSLYGHQVTGGFDPYGAVLTRWVGDDAKTYLAYTHEPKFGTAFTMLPDRERA